MRHICINRIIVLLTILLLFSIYTFAAGGGGGGGSSSGLGFAARDSIFILVNQDYSAKFSLKNGTKYKLTIEVEDGNATVNFGNVVVELKKGDNFVDLNSNGFANINFNLVKVKGIRADVRIINVKEQIKVSTEDVIIMGPEIEEEKEEEDEIKCAELKTMRERVSCRLDLEGEELEEELELYYLPEECRAVYFTPRKQCIERYESVHVCWKFPVGNERILCVKRVMKLGTLQEEKRACNGLTGKEKASCVRDLRNKVYNLIKWRFYDLEERAEDFMLRGLIDKKDSVNFIVKVEENKIKFNEARTKEERKNIILDVRIAWNELVKQIEKKIRG